MLHCGLPARPTQSGTLNHRAGGGNRRNAAIAVRVCRNNACGTITSAIWNLCDPQPRLRARFTGGAASVLVDFRIAMPVEAVALISTNLSTNATARWRLRTLEVPNAAHDSGILPAHTGDEATDAHRDLVRRLGAARDALWIPETGDARAETNRRAIWGAANQPGEEAAAARGSFPLLNRAFRIVERV